MTSSKDTTEEAQRLHFCDFHVACGWLLPAETTKGKLPENENE
jgi:hypothetical protein